MAPRGLPPGYRRRGDRIVSPTGQTMYTEDTAWQLYDNDQDDQAPKGAVHDAGIYGDVTDTELVDLIYGGPDRQETVQRSKGLGPAPAYDFTRYRKGDLSDDQIADLYVHRAPNTLASRWRQPDGTYTNSLIEQATELDRNVQAILSVDPSLQSDPMAVWAIASEPFLADRLRGMAKGRDFLTIRAEVVHLEQMSEDHQVAWWDGLPERKQDAYREAGYLPPQERPEVEQSGFGGALSAIGDVAGTVGDVTGVSDVLGVAFDVLGTAANAVGTVYRQADTGIREGTLFSDSWWTKWDDAWHGESFIRQDNKDLALDLVNGDSDALDLLMRVSGGDTIDDIVGQYAEIGTVEYADAFRQVQDFLQDPLSTAALDELERGKTSFGRSLAAVLPDVSSVGLGEGGPLTTVISGFGDAAFQLVADPTLVAGKAAKGARLARFGVRLDDGLGWAGRVDKLLSVSDGATLARRVDEIRGGAVAVDQVSAYWAGLARLPLTQPQRAAVALADHTDALLRVGTPLERVGDADAATNLAQALPNSRKMLPAFQRYIETTVPRLPDGTLARAVDADDVVDFYKDAAGASSLLRGHWAGSRVDRMVIPTLTRKGSAAAVAKIDLHRSMDWLDDQLLYLKTGQRLEPGDVDNPAVIASEIQARLASGGRLAADDAFTVLRGELEAAGLDAETVTRQVHRLGVARAGVTLTPGEAPADGMLRAIVTAFDDEQADTVRQAWAGALAEAVGATPDQAAARLARIEDDYRTALGLTGPDTIYDRTNSLNTAVIGAAEGDTAAGKARYLQSLQRAGMDDDAIDEAAGAFDRLLDEHRSAHANDPVSADVADPARNEWFRRLVAYPLAAGLAAPFRFVESVAKQIPKQNFLALDGENTPVVLQQLMNFGVRGPTARRLYSDYLLATEAGRRSVIRGLYRSLFSRMGILDDPAYADFVGSWLSAADQSYGIDDLLETIDGGIHHAGIYPVAHQARAVAIPRFREIDAQVKRNRLMGLLNGYGNRVLGINSQAADRFMSVWRSAVVLRPAMIPRAGGEELLAQYARWGPAHVARQQIITRLYGLDPATRRLKETAQARRAVADALDTGVQADLPAGVNGLDGLLRTAGVTSFRNQVHLLGESLQANLGQVAGRVLNRQERHAMRLLATNDYVQRNFLEMSGTEAGIVPFSRLETEQAGSPFAFTIRNDDGRDVPFVMRTTGEWADVVKGEQFFDPHWSNRLQQVAHDPAAREAARVLALDIGADDAGRIADVATARLGFTDRDPTVATNRLRTAFASISFDGRDRLIDWVDQADPRPFPPHLLTGDDLATIGRVLNVDDVTRARLASMFDELTHADRQALLVAAPDVGGVPVGWLGALTEPGALYRGSALGGIDPAALTGGTFAGLAGRMDPHAWSGPGLYLTSSGAHAEANMAADLTAATHQATVQRFAWKDGAPPRFIDSGAGTHQAEMAEQMRAVTVDVLRQAVPGPAGQILATAYDLDLTGPQVAALIDDLAPGLTDPQRNAIGRVVTETARLGRPDATDVAAAIRSERTVLAGWLQTLGTHGAGLDATDNPLGRFFNTAYGRHVVDHFAAQGYAGISDQLTDAEHLAVALWDPSLLEHTGDLPFTQAIAHQVLTRDAWQQRQALALSLVGTDEAKVALRDLAVDRVTEQLAKMDLSHMDRMAPSAGVVQPPPRGHVRIHVPMVPQRTVRALADLAARTGPDVDVARQGAVTGTGPILDRATLLGAGDQDLPPAVADLIERLATGSDDSAWAARLGTRSPRQAQQLLDDLQGVVAYRLGDDHARAVHLGYIDVTGGEWDTLATAAPDGDAPLITARLREPDGPPAGLVTDPYAPAAVGPGGRRIPVPTTFRRTVTSDDDLRWIDSDLVVDRGVSFRTDDPIWVIPDLTDADRDSAVAAIRVLARRRPDADPLTVATANINSDQDLLFALRQQVADVFAGDRAAADLVMGELAQPAAQRDLATLTDLIGPDKAAAASTLLGLPDPLLPYLFEGADVTAAGVPLGPTRWAMADGKSWMTAQRDLATKIVDEVQAVTYGDDGTPIHTILRPVADGTYRYRTHLAGRDVRSRPAKVTGPRLTPPADPGAAQALVNRGMDWIGRGISGMSRHPLFRKTFADAIADTEPIFRSIMVDPAVTADAARLVDDIDEAGDLLYETTSAVGQDLTDLEVLATLADEGHYTPTDPLQRWVADDTGTHQVTERLELTGDEQRLVTWWRSEQVMRDEAIKVASTRALDAAIPYIDDHRIRSQFAERIRNVVPFWFAEEQFYKRWARTFVHSPEAFRRMTLAHNAVRNVGWVEENEYGEDVFVYPGAQYAAKAVASLAELVLPGDWSLPIEPLITGQLTYASPGFDRIGLPSAGPLAAIPLRALRSTMPELALPLEQTLLGERGAGRSLPESILPSSIYRLVNVVAADDEDIMSTTIGAIQMLEANHPEWVPGPDASAHDIDVYLERVRNYSRTLLFTRAILGTTLPASPQFDFDPDDLSDEFVGYLSAGVPIEQAAADFLADHPEATPYTIFRTETPSKAPTDPTEAVFDELVANGEFYEKWGSAGPWLLPAALPDDPFDRKAWYEMLAHHVRVYKDDDEFYEDLKFAEAAEVYFDSQTDKDTALARADTVQQRDAVRLAWREWSEEYLAGHRVFAQKLNAGEGQRARQAVLDELAGALADPDRPDVEHAGLLADLLVSYRDYTAYRLTLGRSAREDRLRDAARDSMLDVGEDLAAQHPTVRLFWRRILLPEVDPGRGYAADDPAQTDQGAA